MNAAARHADQAGHSGHSDFQSTLSTRVCHYCDLEVQRTEVHKDRRGRYSCRNCRDQGLHFGGWKRISYRLWTMRHRGNKLLMVYMVLAAVGLMLLFGVLDFWLLG